MAYAINTPEGTRDRLFAECREPPRVKFLVHFGGGELSRALKAVDEHAVGTCELSPCENLDETERLAREKGAGAVLVLEKGTERVVQL